LASIRFDNAHGRRKKVFMTADDKAPAEQEARKLPPRRRVARQSSLTEAAAALVHELNQPLSAASNYIEAAQRLLQAYPQRPPQLAEALDHAAAQLLRAGRMVRELHDVISHGDLEK
jgi:signal transduction histidine kinase